ncbi:ADP-ribosylglycohydrolase family protein [Paraglaciecola sp.]|uniref:ADP-ribosylglycohydrolase family protein n=1 Tax=Paraglaciecola sp. TaxID=1920173 RepID=UPI0030F48D97
MSQLLALHVVGKIQKIYEQRNFATFSLCLHRGFTLLSTIVNDRLAANFEFRTANVINELKVINRCCLVTALVTCFVVSQSALAKNIAIAKGDYQQRLEGFWLGQSIANWTGLITEMDKIGTPETMPFYTDEDWGKPDLKAMWGEYVPHASTINFFFEQQGTPWGADDDTDIEYMYLHLLHQHNTSKLTAAQIRHGWLKHIYSETDAPLYKKFPDSEASKENFLWVANERARILMEQGMLPPHTGTPENNPYYNMIDAQLTTEIFGLLAPTRPDIALDIADLPISTTASHEAKSISQFYVVMHALASSVDSGQTLKQQSQWLADEARGYLPEDSFPAKMYDFIKSQYLQNPDSQQWEVLRDVVFLRYQQQGQDGYQYQQPYDAGINFAASLISWFYGEGDIVRTIQIGSLVGWDSDNPTATWGGLLGFMLGKEGVSKAFNQPNLSDTYWIHRTRRNFPDYTPDLEGEDNLAKMAKRGLDVIDKVVVEQMQGQLSQSGQTWTIPAQAK